MCSRAGFSLLYIAMHRGPLIKKPMDMKVTVGLKGIYDLPIMDESSVISLLLMLSRFSETSLYKASGSRGRSLYDRSISVKS